MYCCCIVAVTVILYDFNDAALASYAKEVGYGVQGRSRSYSENIIALRQMSSLISTHGYSFDRAVKETAAVQMASPNTIREVGETWIEQQEVVVKDNSERGSGNPLHPLRLRGEPTLEIEVLIHRKLQLLKEMNQWETAGSLAVAVYEELNIHCSDQTMLRYLHSLGYCWTDRRFIGSTSQANRRKLKDSFIHRLASALRDPNGVLVYFDESYIRTRHAARKGWIAHKSIGSNEVKGTNNGGERILILHAMTRDGMLEAPGAISTNVLTEERETAEFVFTMAGTDLSDYHDTISGEQILLYFGNRLIPAFKRCYPGRKMYLVLDNASYHVIQGKSYITPSTADKKRLAGWLAPRKRQIEVIRDGKHITFTSDVYGLRDSKKHPAPTVEELRAACTAAIEADPSINKSEVQKLMDTHGYGLIYTPPYTPQFQPIELIWGVVKNGVARRASTSRSVDTCREQTEEEFSRITPQIAQACEKHAFRYMSEYMRTHPDGIFSQWRDFKHFVSEPQLAPAIVAV